jgi:hypothetical protein
MCSLTHQSRLRVPLRASLYLQHRGVFREMKNEIPVLWINGQYWTKHRITTEEAILALQRVQGEVPT